jgi:hypothetical protein
MGMGLLNLTDMLEGDRTQIMLLFLNVLIAHGSIEDKSPILTVQRLDP